MELEEGDIILCTVDRIVGTGVFVKIEGTSKEGGITLSEIAPGRIRNLRDYVVPKKKIVCKVLRIDSSENIHLSLRRVTPKEIKEVKEKYQLESSYQKMLKTVLGEIAEKIIAEIQKKEKLVDFLQASKEDSKELEKIVGKEQAKKILDILKNQKKKTYEIKKVFDLTTNQPNGLELIKNILKSVEKAEIKYISAGKYSIKTKDANIKNADHQLKKIIDKIRKQAKTNKLDFDFKEK